MKSNWPRIWNFLFFIGRLLTSLVWSFLEPIHVPFNFLLFSLRPNKFANIYTAVSAISISCSSFKHGVPCHIHLPVHLWIIDLHSRAAKKNMSHGNEVLPQDTTHFTQRPHCQWESLCQDPAGNQTTWRSPDQCKKKCKLKWYGNVSLFIRSCQNNLAMHSERGKKTRQAGQAWSSPRPRRQWRKMEETGCKVICGALTTPVVKG